MDIHPKATPFFTKIACLGISMIVLTTPFSLSASEPHLSKAREVEALRQELAELNRELHKYKAQLFRSSHPEEKAKIVDMGQQLAYQKELNEQLSESLRSIEAELLQFKKEAGTSKVTIDASAAMVQKQHIATRELEKDSNNLENHISNETLESPETFTSTIAVLETQKADLKQALQHLSALTYMEKKILAEILSESNETLQNKMAEIEFLRQQLAYNTIPQISEGALNEISSLQSALQEVHQEAESSKQLLSQFFAALTEEKLKRFDVEQANVSRLNDLLLAMHYVNRAEIKNSELTQENAQLKSDLATGHHDLARYYIESHETMKESLLEKEENFASAQLYYQTRFKAFHNQIEVAKDYLYYIEGQYALLNAQFEESEHNLAAEQGFSELIKYYLVKALDESAQLKDEIAHHQKELANQEELLGELYSKTEKLQQGQALQTSHWETEIEAMQAQNALQLAATFFNSASMVEGLYSDILSLQNELKNQQKQNSFIQATLDRMLAKQEKEKEKSVQLENELNEALNYIALLNENLEVMQEKFQASETAIADISRNAESKISELEALYDTQKRQKKKRLKGLH